jgi:hypothetical protein
MVSNRWAKVQVLQLKSGEAPMQHNFPALTDVKEDVQVRS